MIYSEAAERQTIGSMLLSERVADLCLNMVRRDDFVLSDYGDIYAGIQRLRKQDKPVVYESILEWLRTQKKTELELKGYETKMIDAAEYAMFPVNGPIHAETVRTCAWRRRTKQSLEELLSTVVDEDPDVLRTQIKAFGESWYEGTSPSLVRLREVEVDEGEQGVPTGFGASIDGLTGVGWVCGQVNVVSAQTKGGKTTFMIGSFAECAKRGLRVVYATFADLNPKQLKRRLLKQACGVGSFPKVKLDLIETYQDALADVDDPYGAYENALLYDARTQGRDVETFAGKMLVENSRNPISIIFCDYAQKITSREVKGSEKTRQLEHVSDQLDELAGKLGCPIVLGSQVTKGTDGEWMTKYARALEEDAGFVLRLIREDNDRAKVVCKLNRFGPQDVEIPLIWNDAKVKFEPVQSHRFGRAA